MSARAKYLLDEIERKLKELSQEINYSPPPYSTMAEMLEEFSDDLLRKLLRGEHPQTIALILGTIPPFRAAKLLDCLPAGLLGEVAVRIATQAACSADILDEITRVIHRKCAELMSGKGPVRVGGIDCLKAILAQTGLARAAAIRSALEAEHPDLAAQLAKGPTPVGNKTGADRVERGRRKKRGNP